MIYLGHLAQAGPFLPPLRIDFAAHMAEIFIYITRLLINEIVGAIHAVHVSKIIPRCR